MYLDHWYCRIMDGTWPLPHFLPGFYVTWFHFGFLLAILAAIIERPFIKVAGIRQSTLAYSICAGGYAFIGMGLLSLCAIPFAALIIDLWFRPVMKYPALMILLGLLGVVLSSIIKGRYLRCKMLLETNDCFWVCIFIGSVVSGSTIFALGYGFSVLHRMIEANDLWKWHLKRLIPTQLAYYHFAAILVGGFILLAAIMVVGSRAAKRESSEDDSMPEDK